MNRTLTSLALVSLLGLAACGTRAAPSEEPEPLSEAERAIAQTVQALYEAYSFEGDPPSTERILEHFAPDARLGTVNEEGELNIRSAPGYFEWWQRWVEEEDIRLLQERETFGETEWFGDIAHRISAVAFHVNTTDTVTGRGVISLQLARVADRWLVQSMIWDVTTEDRPIPARYREP